MTDKGSENILFLRTHALISRCILAFQRALLGSQLAIGWSSKEPLTMNHLSTARALVSPVVASAIAAKISGCSHQYAVEGQIYGVIMQGKGSVYQGIQ